DKEKGIATAQGELALSLSEVGVEQATLSTLQEQIRAAQSDIAERQDKQIHSLQQELDARKGEIAALQAGARRLLALELAVPIDRAQGERIVKLLNAKGTDCWRGAILPNQAPSGLHVQAVIETNDTGYVARCLVEAEGSISSDQAAAAWDSAKNGIATVFGR